MNDSDNHSLDLLFMSNSKAFSMVERYGKAANNSRLVCDYIAEQLDREEYQWGMVNPNTEKVYQRMKTCASWLTFREYVDLGKTILKSAKFCSKHLLCQACAIRRGANLLQAYVPRIEKVLLEAPKLTPWMITFTVKNGVSLRERHSHLKRNITRLLNNRKCYLKGTRGFSYTEMSKVTGGVFAFEEPKAKDGEGWHPHLHMLAICTDKPDAGYVNPDTGEGHGLRKEWFDLTGDSFQVDVRRKEDQPIIEMACEVMKYAVKFSEQDPEDTWKAFQVLSGQRLIRSFGSLFGVKVSKSMVDSPLSGAYIDRIFSYVGHGHYEQIAKIDCTELYDDCSHDVDSDHTHGAATRKQGVWTESTSNSQPILLKSEFKEIEMEHIVGHYVGYNRRLDGHEAFYPPENEIDGFICVISRNDNGTWLLEGEFSDGDISERTFGEFEEATACSKALLGCEHLYFLPHVGEDWNRKWHETTAC